MKAVTIVSNPVALISFALLGGLVASSSLASAATLREVRDERVEISLDNVFAPLHGYDDNDPVEVVFHGFLPNACYTVGDTFYEHADDGTTIRLKQYAVRKRNDVCADGATLPPHLAMAVPFTHSVAIGTLPAADYTLSFRNEEGRDQTRTLNVAHAATSLVDSLPYAVVNTLMVPSIVNAGSSVEVTFSGVLNSSCIDLADQVEVVREKDVIVILPTVSVKSPGIVCTQVLRPFTKTVNVGALSEGDTLIHVRSMNGKSLNAIVQADPVRTL